MLVSSGGLDREVSPLLRAASLPGSELALPLVEAAGHFPHLADPERFAEVVADFVRSTRPRRAGAAGRRAFRELLRGGSRSEGPAATGAAPPAPDAG